MPEFKALRLRLEAWARTELETGNPAYVETFNRRMTDTGNDLTKVVGEAGLLLKEPTSWHQVITALFDVEYWMDRCRQTVWYMGSAPPGGDARISHPGVWLAYHIDSWYLIAYGLLDRIRVLISLTCRHVIRPNSAKWVVVETALVNDVQKLKGVIDKSRNAIAHGGGIVEALAETKLLEPYIVLGGWESGASDEMDVFGSYYDSMVKRSAKWQDAVKRGTQRIFASSEAVFQKLRGEAFP